MNDDASTPKVVHSPKKAEPTIYITINLYDKNKSHEGNHYIVVPISHAAFYIPNFKDTLVYNNSDFIVMEVKRDFDEKSIIISAYKS